MSLGVSFIGARTVSTLCAVLLSYSINTKFSFRAHYTIKGFISYVAGLSISIASTYLTSLTLYYLVFDSTRPLLSTNLGALVAAMVNYVFQRFVTYRKYA